jgi:ABC-type polysaccharide/polyol phosphate export permease
MLANPLAIIVETFKWGLFGIGQLYPRELGVTAGAIGVILVAGLAFFNQSEARAVAQR